MGGTRHSNHDRSPFELDSDPPYPKLIRLYAVTFSLDNNLCISKVSTAVADRILAVAKLG